MSRFTDTIERVNGLRTRLGIVVEQKITAQIHWSDVAMLEGLIAELKEVDQKLDRAEAALNGALGLVKRS